MSVPKASAFSRIPVRPSIRSLVATSLMLLLCISLTGARPGKNAYSTHDKAAYLNQTIISFLRPGLVSKIESGKIAVDLRSTGVPRINTI